MSMATANLANAHCGVTPAGPNLVVEPRDGGTALVARLELRALTRTHNAPALEAEGRLQPAPSVFTGSQLVCIADAQLLPHRNVARCPKRDLLHALVPVVVHVGLAGRVEPRAHDEDRRGPGGLPSTAIVVPAGERVGLEYSEGRGIGASPAVREREVSLLVGVGEGGESCEDRRVRMGLGLGEKGGLGKNELSQGDGARRDDTLPLSGDTLHGERCCWTFHWVS